MSLGPGALPRESKLALAYAAITVLGVNSVLLVLSGLASIPVDDLYNLSILLAVPFVVYAYWKRQQDYNQALGIHGKAAHAVKVGLDNREVQRLQAIEGAC